MLGAYGPWAAAIVGDAPARLSFRRPEFNDVATWRPRARAAVDRALLAPARGAAPSVEVAHRFEYDGLEIEHLSWKLPYGPPTEALILQPKGAKGRLPAILALHDHGGNKYFGLRKITRMGPERHPLMVEHQDHYYGGVAWANEIARRGYVVLVHDAFLFGSRRVRAADVPKSIARDLVEVDPESPDEIRAYNKWASDHESIVAKSLFCAGTTWPGVFLSEDRAALDILAARANVDPRRIGCAGLSGGGLRTAYLAGVDDRIKAACCVGMMTTWRDYLLNKTYTHTWMIYPPGLPLELDYPEIAAMRAPLPLLVQYDEEDSLFTLPEMKRADRMIAEIYAKAGAPDRYRGAFYPGPHKFDLAMQREAFDWFDARLV
ncbi:MAG: prolyl oligopeptidase family serine peptidase [Isosphaeraceae bacterium]|nr:prolyl oligopeptidase family serine peptidase [Isosphaeraceae bacterium]